MAELGTHLGAFKEAYASKYVLSARRPRLLSLAFKVRSPRLFLPCASSVRTLVSCHLPRSRKRPGEAMRGYRRQAQRKAEAARKGDLEDREEAESAVQLSLSLEAGLWLPSSSIAAK